MPKLTPTLIRLSLDKLVVIDTRMIKCFEYKMFGDYDAISRRLNSTSS